MNVINLTPVNAGINSEIGEVVENGDIINGEFITIELLTRFLYTHTVLYPNNYISCNFEKDLHGAGSGELILRNDISSFCDQSQYIKVLKTSFNKGIQTNIEVIYFGYIDSIQEKDGKVKFLSIANLSQLYYFNFNPNDLRRGLYALVKEAANLLNECVRFNTSDPSYPFYVIQSEFNNWQVVGLPDNPQVLEWNEKSIADILKNDFIVRNGVRRGFLEILPTGKITINEQENIQEATPDFTFNVAEVNYTKKINKNTGRFQESGSPNIENYNEPLTMISITPQKVIQDIYEAEFIEDTIRDPKFSTLESGFIDDVIDTGQIAEIKYTRKNPYNTQVFSENDIEVIIDDQELLQNMESEDGYSVVLHDSIGGVTNNTPTNTRDIAFKYVRVEARQIFIGFGLDISETYSGTFTTSLGATFTCRLYNGLLEQLTGSGAWEIRGEYNPSTGNMDITSGFNEDFVNIYIKNVNFTAGQIRNIQSNTVICNGTNKTLVFSQSITPKKYDAVMYRSCVGLDYQIQLRKIRENGDVYGRDGGYYGNLDWETMIYTDENNGNISYLEIYSTYPIIDEFNLLIEFESLIKVTDNIKANTRDIDFKYVNLDLQDYFVGFGLDYIYKTYTGILTTPEGGKFDIRLENGVLLQGSTIRGNYNKDTGFIDRVGGFGEAFINFTLNQVSFSAGEVRNIQADIDSGGGTFSEKITPNNYNIIVRYNVSTINKKIQFGNISINGDINIVNVGIIGILDWNNMTIEIYSAAENDLLSMEIYNAIKPMIAGILKLDLSEPIPLRDKLENFGVVYSKVNQVQTSGVMKTAPLEYIIKIPSGYKITKIQYFINDYRSVNPYFNIVYNRSIFQVVKMIAELVKYRVEGGKILSKAIFNGTQDKIF